MSLASKTRSGGSSWEKWPQQALAFFAIIIVVIYALIFLTGDRSAKPKLGIDLQGGTRVTLVPQGAEPTREQLDQARNILENRVNGMGVSGAEVIVDGDTLVITVPGEDTSEARAVGQTSQLYFRPVVAPSGMDTDAVVTEIEKMANRWIETGILTPEQAKEKLDQTAEAIKSQAEQLKAQAEQLGTEAPETKIPDFKVTAKPPKPAANSIEAMEMRENQLETLKADRQSEDLNVQIAAGSLMVCGDGPDPMLGADDPALPLVACDDSQGQTMILDAVPVLIGEDETNPRAQRLTGNEIDTNRPINAGINQQRRRPARAPGAGHWPRPPPPRPAAGDGAWPRYRPAPGPPRQPGRPPQRPAGCGAGTPDRGRWPTPAPPCACAPVPTGCAAWQGPRPWPRPGRTGSPPGSAARAWTGPQRP